MKKLLLILAAALAAQPVRAETRYLQAVGGNQVVPSTRAFSAPAGGGASCSEVETSGLIARFKLNENGGSTVGDSAGSFVGTLVNSPAWATGRCGSALTFTAASSQRVTFSTAPIVGNRSVYSILFWAKWTSSAAGRIYAERDTGSTNALIQFEANANVPGEIEFGYRTNSGGGLTFLSSGDLNLDDGAWHHFALTQNDKNHRNFFVDGVLVATDSNDMSGAQTLVTANIGASDSTTVSSFFDGSVDEIGFYGIELSTTQVNNVKTAQTP